MDWQKDRPTGIRLGYGLIPTHSWELNPGYGSSGPGHESQERVATILPLASHTNHPYRQQLHQHGGGDTTMD